MARRSPVPSPARVVSARILYGMQRLFMLRWFRVDMRLSDTGACPHLDDCVPSVSDLGQVQRVVVPPGPLCRLHAGAGAKPRLQLL